MIDIIFGDVMVVCARLRATVVVTLRCNKLSDIEISDFNPELHALVAQRITFDLILACSTAKLVTIG